MPTSRGNRPTEVSRETLDDEDATVLDARAFISALPKPCSSSPAAANRQGSHLPEMYFAVVNRIRRRR